MCWLLLCVCVLLAAQLNVICVDRLGHPVLFCMRIVQSALYVLSILASNVYLVTALIVVMSFTIIALSAARFATLHFVNRVALSSDCWALFACLCTKIKMVCHYMHRNILNMVYPF